MHSSFYSVDRIVYVLYTCELYIYICLLKFVMCRKNVYSSYRLYQFLYHISLRDNALDMLLGDRFFPKWLMPVQFTITAESQFENILHITIIWKHILIIYIGIECLFNINISATWQTCVGKHTSTYICKCMIAPVKRE